MGPEPVTFFAVPVSVRRSLRYLSLVFTSTLKRKHRHKKNGHVYFSRAYVSYAYVVAFSD